MTAPFFDPVEIMREVGANFDAPPAATIATLRHNGANCRNVATVATPLGSGFGRSVATVATVATVDAPDFERAALSEERAALCANRVPAAYRDTWARLNHRKPFAASEAEWRQARDDGGRFLDAWGALAAEWGWTVGELFDLPRGAASDGGLLWFIRGATVEAFGPDYAGLDDGRIFDRGTTGGEKS